MTRISSLAALPLSAAWKSRLVFALLAITPALTAAQSSMGEMRRQATRAELERAAKAAEDASLNAPDEKTRAQMRSDAAAIRMRLTNGDFIPGDRINLMVLGDTALTDTFTVRGDRMLPLPNIPPISLQGVLDSELEAHLTKELQRYIKQVTLEATPLVRINMLGFPQSSFITVPVDQSITDVIAAAGGWGNVSQMAVDKTVVRRDGKILMDAKATADAIRMGKTVGDMSMRDGDELYLPDKASGFSWTRAMGAVSALTGLFWIIRVSRR